MDLQEEVKTHTRKVEAGEQVRYSQACAACGAADRESFRLYDRQRRKFRLVVERCIHVALSWILRVAVSALWQAVYRLPALSPCRVSGLPRSRC